MKLHRVLSFCALGIVLAGCSIFSRTPSMDMELSGATYGVGGSAIPGGVAQVSIGATSIRGVLQPTSVETASGDQVPFTVDAPCGTKNVPSMMGTSAANATASVSNGMPGVGGGSSEGMALGEAAILAELANLQEKATPAHDTMLDYRSCPSAPAAH